MMIFGIDPGVNGAIAAYNTETGSLDIYDVPFEVRTINRKERKSFYYAGFKDLMQVWRDLGSRHVVLEKVGAMPNDGAVGAFTFGFGAGVMYGVLLTQGWEIEHPTPQVWKKALRVPVDSKGIASRADEVFPGCSHHWRGPRGGIKHDRCEAALMTKYGASIWDKDRG